MQLTRRLFERGKSESRPRFGHTTGLGKIVNWIEHARIIKGCQIHVLQISTSVSSDISDSKGSSL